MNDSRPIAIHNILEDFMGTATHLNGNVDTNKIKNQASALLEEGMDEINPYLKRAKEIAGDAAHKTSDFVKTYPGYTVLGAAAIGFLTAAYIFRHRNHN